MNKKEMMYKKIENHGRDLNKIFHTKYGNIELCKKLFRLEHKARQLAEDYCNGVNGITTENWEEKCKPILKKVNNILGNKKVPIFLNGDARGYALKIDDESAEALEIYKDWGGYGIIAPDFRD
jgi:hypothetical protein